ncbi:MAG: hypothetical protein KF819_30710 [Labilithrix sp.]|nr:hypothetical protein [Labilithrix sp.]
MTAGGDGAPPSVTIATGGVSWVRARTPRILSTIAKGLWGLSSIGSLAMAIDGAWFLSLLSLVTMFAWPLFIVSYIVTLTQTSLRGAIEVTPEGLALLGVGARRTMRRAEIRSAYVVDRQVAGGSIATLEVELTSGDVLAATFPEPDAARKIVAKLGFGAGGGRVHVPLAKPARRLLHLPIALACWIGATTMAVGAVTVFAMNDGPSWTSAVGAGAMSLYPALALAIYTALRRFARGAEVTVGDDGVLVVKGTRRRFIPRRDVGLVVGSPRGGLLVETRSGERVVVEGAFLDAGRLEAVVRLLHERSGVASAGADRHAHYERAGRPIEQWRDHLARAMSEAGYRETAATADEAAAILRSPHATGEQRVGAALALRIAGSPPERIRVAVDAAVDDRTREALEAVAEAEKIEDDERIEKALRRLG